MQSKKEEVKQEIESAALKVFFRKGFSDAKMNDIADEIQISVGNIYTYFKNKKDLFYSVVPPSLVDYLKNVLVENIRIDNQTFFDDVNNEKKSAIVQEQINILTQYSRQIVIIFEKNKGTVYSNAKNELIDLMIETKRPYIKDHYKRYEIGTEENMILLKIIANNVINMILDLLKHEMSADSRRRIFEALSLYWLHGLKSLNE
ncbi:MULTISPECIES: TetR/AcrR family transcriptional regulator [Paenibacillus]|uniref:TetR family transcriptional regulator n=1 Tax=Paenibacillus odorifer TaxID=189426 RepID=A0A1R0X3T7_9BACL|nr:MULTISPECIES: TetR/AcrR family transcriptional regulator [Paenibacillus]ETT67544.1 transcriptional regulator [Paenibacillus sp. FSL H8-237]OMD27998.1 TetR family transcriptional regulator [Paenibacillus odorifer]OME42081.1 TetR family transcriptional regulator [Paenibacillus odorifer]OME57254.1 TetR family transcriptional regulator [Paenibacillus odorifer]OME58034.1 TetR family transcriptional regulator [Paenibacillus odorifer]